MNLKMGLDLRERGARKAQEKQEREEKQEEERIKKKPNANVKGGGGKVNAKKAEPEEALGADDDWLWMQSDLRVEQGILTLCVHCEGSSPRYE
jgi:hypothetical protein